MNDCKKHKRMIDGYKGDIEQLANDIGDLHYEELAKLLFALDRKLNRDSYQDSRNGRTKLAQSLTYAGHSIFNAARRIDEAWEISKPYMEENNENK